MPTEIICKYASKDLKVVLSGDGADEIFLGYNRYLFGHKIKKFPVYTWVRKESQVVAMGSFFHVSRNSCKTNAQSPNLDFKMRVN